MKRMDDIRVEIYEDADKETINLVARLMNESGFAATYHEGMGEMTVSGHGKDVETLIDNLNEMENVSAYLDSYDVDFGYDSHIQGLSGTHKYNDLVIEIE